MKNKLEELLREDRMIPSVSTVEQLKYAVERCSFSCIMLKMGDINTIGKMIAHIHKYEKSAMVHLDSIKGISKDKSGIHYLRRIGVDSLITMKSQNIRMIKEEGIHSVLGTFLVDSSSVAVTLQNMHTNKPDAVIAMPMTIPDSIYEILQENTQIPIMAGGLGMSREIIDHVLGLGVRACAVTDKNILEQYEKI
ncbi:MAG: glycerol-3-phosphate responsive antiterminator [Lachnospiraceae bacterium]|nr:glycerol-3-phosphate responsive antiterminator [Lachnospiraceae bacterium]